MQHPVVSLCPALLCSTLWAGRLKNPITITVVQALGLEGFPTSQEVPVFMFREQTRSGSLHGCPGSHTAL